MKTTRHPIVLQNSQTAYESTITARAILRAGSNPHLKGHIHEILLQDSKNMSSLFNGQSTALSKSATAKTADTTRMAQRAGASGSSTLTSATWQAAKSDGKGYATGAAAGAAMASGLAAVGAGAGITAIATAAAPIALAVGVGYLVSSVWDSICD